MIDLLDDQEVLSFELDDRILSQYFESTMHEAPISSALGMILVQAKDLFIYNINFY